MRHTVIRGSGGGSSGGHLLFQSKLFLIGKFVFLGATLGGRLHHLHEAQVLLPRWPVRITKPLSNTHFSSESVIWIFHKQEVILEFQIQPDSLRAEAVAVVSGRWLWWPFRRCPLPCQSASSINEFHAICLHVLLSIIIIKITIVLLTIWLFK